MILKDILLRLFLFMKLQRSDANCGRMNINKIRKKNSKTSEIRFKTEKVVIYRSSLQ